MKSTANQSHLFVSVIIPVEAVGDNLRRALAAVLKSSYREFEILVFASRETKDTFPRTRILVEPRLAAQPAEKRNLALKYARGEIFAFIDDDVYPSRKWLAAALGRFEAPGVAAVGGPMLTPSDDTLMEKGSGWVWASFLGSGGAGTYRCLAQKEREVDDYPTANLLVRRADFEAVGGFDSSFWPGEDTKLCLDLTSKLGKKIIYDPRVLVYHHRRALFLPHLRQIRGYGLHRGYFARILPKTSRRLGYFLPSFFTLFLFLTPPLIFFFELLNFCSLSLPLFLLYVAVLFFYALLLWLTGVWVAIKSKDLRLGLLVVPGIFLTHVYYGLMFIKGFFSRGVKRNIHPFFEKEVKPVGLREVVR